jgi:homogentisate 1,2-dioxygenase
MCYYYRLGNIPQKRHTQFRQPNGNLYAEELVSSKGFSGVYSLLYHTFLPTQVAKIGEPTPYKYELVKEYPLQHTHLRTLPVQVTGTDFLEARQILLANPDVAMGICNVASLNMSYYYKNGEADEMLFFHEGAGWLYSQFGKLRIEQGDYVVIPRTTIYRLETEGAARILVVESATPIETVRRYRNEFGQLEEHSPYCERDIRPPQELVTETNKGEYLVKIKKGGFLYHYYYDFSPLDVVGWDGYLYPYCLSIHDFEPITGRIHQPPPVHQTFQSGGFVICSFVPRLFDYHPQAIPAPYNHSNIDSDEVLYYVEGNFMSRKGIDKASFTIHPGGLPHGPHPGTVEASIGAKETQELAVMLDTFRPLYLTKAAIDYLDKTYPMSWSINK